MFTQTWKKYLPLLSLFLKRSAIEPQKVQLNQTDFERALGGRKIKLSFSNLQINKGRINNLIKNSVLAKDLADALEDNETTKYYLRKRNIVFALSSTYELQITDVTPVELPEALSDSKTNEDLALIEPSETESL
ncbi:MAG TPA: hypothetical protein VFV46_06080 [Lacibacter sp.]|nr:hypothetical protein [Lacibacter sp.]